MEERTRQEGAPDAVGHSARGGGPADGGAGARARRHAGSPAAHGEWEGMPETDEWDVDRLDLDAYLRRIGYAARPGPDPASLAALHRAHVAAIPFENLDITLGNGVSVDLPDIQSKLVDRGRGGYCYEHGLLFAAALKRIGFRVDRALARIGGHSERPRHRSHLVLLVRADGARWLADVGFGSGLLEPLRLDDDSPHRQGEWTYRLVPAGENSWELRERQGHEWATLYGFADERHHASDVLVANHFTSTYPRSPFVRQSVVVAKDERAVRRLHGRQLALVRPEHPSEERTLTDPEVAAALLEDFGLPLEPAEVAEITARLPAVASATDSADARP